jgi:ABC-2 type transport system permease protein
MIQAILHLMKKEFLQTLRDPRLRAVIFIAPVIQLTLFGYAITTDIKQIATVVCDLDRTQESRDLVSAMEGCGYFAVAFRVESPKELEVLLRQGKAKFGLLVPQGFARSQKRTEKAVLVTFLDGSDANSATVAMNYLNQMLGERSERQMAGSRLRLQAMGTGLLAGQVVPQVQVWYNPDLLSAPYMVPGVIALILTVMTLMLTAMGIAREREMGTIEQLIVSPLRPVELIVGKTVPYVLIGLLDVVLILTIGHFLFQLPIRGSLFVLFAAVLIYLLTTVGLGLLISTFSRTQQQAMLSTMFITMPAILLSGFFFPIASMPQWAQVLTLANPIRFFLAILRAILLKGSGPAALWQDGLPLLILGTLIFTGSLLRFRKRLG